MEIGRVMEFFQKKKIAVIELTSNTLKIGDKVSIKGKSTDIMFTVKSMQVDHKEIESAKAGNAIGTIVPQNVCENDRVYKE